MKITCKVLASVVTLFAACLAHAADTKPIARVMSIVDIETDDPTGYAMWVAKTNEIAKAKLGVDDYIRVFQSVFDGHSTNRVRATTTAASVAELMKNALAIENDPGAMQNRERLRTIRKQGARVLYQAVRFDGAVKNAHVYTTLATVTDEPGYLKALDQLRAIFDGLGMKDAKINAYRVIAGRTDHTHRISISAPSADRLAVFMDYAANNAQLGEWVANSAKYRTVVENMTSREITK
jgi:hypothetical protein